MVRCVKEKPKTAATTDIVEKVHQVEVEKDEKKVWTFQQGRTY